MTTEKQSNLMSSEMLHQMTDTPLLDTLMKNNSQMKKFGLSNISEENQTNLLANIQNLMNQNDTNNSLSSNNMDNISQILLKQSNYIGRESRTNTLGISTDNIFQQTNQFQYHQEQIYLKSKQELDNLNFQNNCYRKQLYRKFEDFYDFQNLYQQCLEYFQNNFVKSSQVQGNNQVHKSLLYQLSRNKQNQKEKQKMQFQEYYKPIKNINQTIQIQNILSSSLKTANLKIQQQQNPNKQKNIQIEWDIFKQFKANQLMAILQLHKDLLEEFNNSAEQKKRDINQLMSKFQAIRAV